MAISTDGNYGLGALHMAWIGQIQGFCHYKVKDSLFMTESHCHYSQASVQRAQL